MAPHCGPMVSRRRLLILAGSSWALLARAEAPDSDFWNRKAPADWTPEEIERLLRDSPWAREITPKYASPPPGTDRRIWSENPPIGGVPGREPKASPRVPYRATIRWESAQPIRDAQQTKLPGVFQGLPVVGIFFPYAAGRDVGSRPLEDLRQSTVLWGQRVFDAEIVQAHPEIADAFLVGFPAIAPRGGHTLEFSGRVGLLALRAKFPASGMRYRGKPAL